MKKLLAMAVAASALAFAAPASAQGWQSINQRQAQLDQRIDVGVRNGSLTRNEGVRLRAEFNVWRAWKRAIAPATVSLMASVRIWIAALTR